MTSNPLNKRIIYIVLAFLCVVIAIFVYSSFIKPSYASISQLRAELAQKEILYTTYTTSAQQLSTIVQTGQDASRIRDIAQQVLPTQLNAGQTLAQIIGFARINNVTLTSITTQEVQARAPLETSLKSIGVIQTTASAQGGYASIKTMLQQLEHNMLVLDTDRIRITRTKKDGVLQPTLDANYTITSYYQIP